MDKTAKKTKQAPARKTVRTAPKRHFRYLKKYVELVPDPWGLES